MKYILLPVGILFLFTYTLWIEISLIYDLKLNAGWIFAMGLFFDIIPFFIGHYSSGFSLLIILIVIPLAALTPAALKHSEKLRGLVSEILIILWTAFMCYGLLSIFWSSNPSYGAFKLKVLLIRGIIPGTSAYLISRCFKRVSWTPILTVGFIYTLLTLLFGTVSSEYPGRISLPESNPIIVAQNIFLFLVLLINSKMNIILKTAAALLTAFTALGTQSRGPMAAFIASNLFVHFIFYIRKFRDGYRKIIVISTAALLICIALEGFLSFGFKVQFSNHMVQSRLGTLLNPKILFKDKNFIERLLLQKRAINKFFKSPVIGNGLGSFAPIGIREYPHNIVFELLCEEGIIGLILWTGIIVLTLYKARNNKILLILFLQSVLYTFFSGDIGSNYAYVIVGFMAATAKMNEKSLMEHEKISICA